MDLYISHNWMLLEGLNDPLLNSPSPGVLQIPAMSTWVHSARRGSATARNVSIVFFGKSFEGTYLLEWPLREKSYIYISYKTLCVHWTTCACAGSALQMVIPNTASARGEKHISPHVHDCGYDYHVSSWSSIRPQHSLVSLIVLTSPFLRWGHSIRLPDVPVFLFLLIKEP